jgi:transcriptional accessory protein Tex/SPT6
MLSVTISRFEISDALLVTNCCQTLLGCVSSRKELLERKLMGKIVYNNAASFLRVCDQGLEDKAVDFFDDTRIHPECYIQNDFAPKVKKDSFCAEPR